MVHVWLFTTLNDINTVLTLDQTKGLVCTDSYVRHASCCAYKFGRAVGLRAVAQQGVHCQDSLDRLLLARFRQRLLRF